MNKTVLSVVIVILVIVAGYFILANNDVAPSPADSTSKIDINAVCEGALAYMTFPDAASAEAFVQECKEGKRPEVIEQYKANMGISNDAAI